MKVELQHIPGVPDSPSCHWKVRALVIEGKSPALIALRTWAESEPKNYKSILNSLKLAASAKLPPHSEKHIKKCQGYEGVYEARANAMNARFMFFYAKDKSIIVCTNDYWKEKDGKGQEASMRQADEMKRIYELSR